MEKLLAIVGLTQKAYGRWLLQRFMMGAIVLLGLALITGILISALIIALFYVLYAVLVFNGMTSLLALFTATGSGAIFIVLLIWFIVRYVRRLQRLNSSLFQKNHVGGRFMDTVSAFYDGLMNG